MHESGINQELLQQIRRSTVGQDLHRDQSQSILYQLTHSQPVTHMQLNMSQATLQSHSQGQTKRPKSSSGEKYYKTPECCRSGPPPGPGPKPLSQQPTYSQPLTPLQHKLARRTDHSHSQGQIIRPKSSNYNNYRRRVKPYPYVITEDKTLRTSLVTTR